MNFKIIASKYAGQEIVLGDATVAFSADGEATGIVQYTRGHEEQGPVRLREPDPLNESQLNSARARSGEFELIPIDAVNAKAEAEFEFSEPALDETPMLELSGPTAPLLKAPPSDEAAPTSGRRRRGASSEDSDGS